MKAPFEFQTYEQYSAYLRAYFAAMAMQGYLASSSNTTSVVGAKFAVKCADELLKQLES